MGDELNQDQDNRETEEPERVAGADTRTIPYGEHVDMRRRYKALKASSTHELDTARKRIAELEASVTQQADQLSRHAAESAKSKAFARARASIGDGFELPAKEETAVLAALDRLAYNPDTVDADVSALVDLAKRARNASGGTIYGRRMNDNGQSVSRKAPHELTGRELEALRLEDPDGYQRVAEARREHFRKAAQPKSK